MKFYLSLWIPTAFLMLAPRVAFAKNVTLTESDKKTWILSIKRVAMKPPCCGACKILTHEDTKKIWNYITAGSEREKEKYEAVWLEHKVKLLEEFKRLNPQRCEELYGEIDLAQK